MRPRLFQRSWRERSRDCCLIANRGPLSQIELPYLAVTGLYFLPGSFYRCAVFDRQVRRGNQCAWRSLRAGLSAILEGGMAGQSAKKLPTPATEIPDRLYFRIGEVARICCVEPYVLRFWETQFPNLKPNKGGTGQRLYR